jgi:hypothetical protein
MKRVHSLIHNSCATALEMLREIFDEASYARFLKRAEVESTKEAYAAFRREFEEVKMRRPKCC